VVCDCACYTPVCAGKIWLGGRTINFNADDNDTRGHSRSRLVVIWDTNDAPALQYCSVVVGLNDVMSRARAQYNSAEITILLFIYDPVASIIDPRLNIAVWTGEYCQSGIVLYYYCDHAK